MKTTAVLHAAATGLFVAGFVLVEGLLQIGLFAVGAVLFAAGILFARRSDSGPPGVE